MKIFVKTLKGSHFEIEVKPEDTVADVKKNIETVQGSDVYPAGQQMLIHQGKVLKNGTTLEENKVAENNFIVIMLTKSKSSPGEGSATSAAPTAKVPQSSTPTPSSTPAPTAAQVPVASPSPTPAPAPAPAPSAAPASTAVPGSDVYGQAASSLVAGNNLDGAIQQILDMGGGMWNRDTVVRALRAAFNNPERAVEYLYSFQALRAMVQANPQILQPMLQELGKQNPQLMRLIQEHQADFLRLINEPVEGGEGNMLGQLAAAMPQAIQVTPEEREAIERLEQMGFDHDLVLEVFFACNKNEELAANYLLDHMHEFEE